MLVESHFPVEFLFDETVTLERLQRFSIVFLANTAILSPAEIALIRKYLEQCGRLVATFETSRFDGDRREQRISDWRTWWGSTTRARRNTPRITSGFH